MSMLRRTFAKFNSLFDDLDKDLDDLFDKADLGPLPEGVTETQTTEEEHKPDGSIVKRTVIRRTTITKTTTKSDV